MASSNLPESNTALTYTQPSAQPHLTHTPLAAPKPNELIVKIKAAAINPVDIQLWGNPVVGWLAGKKEKGIGRDYSGEVVAIGEELKKSGKWKIGDEVYGLCNRAVSRMFQRSLFWSSGARERDTDTSIIDWRRHIRPVPQRATW